MEFFQVIQNRQSVRKYKSDPIPEDLLRKILYTANQAPSAGNLQAYEIYVVNDEEKRKRLARAAVNQHFIQEAPVVLVFCTNSKRNEWKYKQRGIHLYSIQDAAISCTYAMLAATNLELANVWIGAFDNNKVREIINAPMDEIPVALLPIGYADEISPTRQRRLLKDLVHLV